MKISASVGNGSREPKFRSRSVWNCCIMARKQTRLMFVGKRDLGIDEWAERTH